VEGLLAGVGEVAERWGERMKTIPLTRGQVAIVDEEDYELLAKCPWWAQWQPKAGVFYAATNIKLESGKFRVLLMHRVIMGLGRGDKRQVDHIDRVRTLDNRRGNLRIATASQNHLNAKIWSNNKSGFKNVFWHKHKRKYQAGFVVNGKYVYLGVRDTAAEAFELVRAAIPTYHGEFGRVDESCIDNRL
jgi:hypothetical protein